MILEILQNLQDFFTGTFIFVIFLSLLKFYDFVVSVMPYILG